MNNKIDSLIIPDELLPFLEGMIKEYNRHSKEYKEKGWNPESWKQCSLTEIYRLWNKSVAYVSLEDFKNNSSHLFDIANFCWFIWYRLDEIKRGN